MKHVKKSRAAILVFVLMATIVLTALFALSSSAANEATAEITGTNLLLTDGITLRLNGTITDGAEQEFECMYIIDGEIMFDEVTPEADGTFYVDIPVGAAQMNEEIEIEIYDMNTLDTLDTITTSVKEYAADQLENGGTYVKAIVSAMLRYGEEAYKYTHDGAASDLLDGLTLTDAPAFPASVLYTYEEGTAPDATDSFQEIRLTLTNALQLTLTTEDGTAATQSMKISEFFDGVTFTANGAASVTASPSLYVELAKNDAALGNLVKALYNYAAQVRSSLTHTHTPATGVAHPTDAGKHINMCACGEAIETVAHTLSAAYTAANKTITYTCTGCSASYDTEVFVLDQFSAKPIWKGTYRSMNFATDPNALTTYDKGINVPVVDGKVQIIKDAEVYAFNPSKKDTGLFAEGLQTYYTDGTDVNKLAFGFDLTMPSGGFSSAAEGDSKPIVRIGARAGNYPNKVFDNYCAMLKDNKLVFFIAGGADDDDTYIDVHTFAPNETANVALVYELSVDGTTTYMTTTAYINGIAKADFKVAVDTVTGGFGTTDKSHVHFITEASYYLNTGLHTGYIVDNMYVANDFTGFDD